MGERLGLCVHRAAAAPATVVGTAGLSYKCWKLSLREAEETGAGMGEGVEAFEMDGGWERVTDVFTICSWQWRGEG